MDNLLFTRINAIADALIAKGEKLTVNNVIVASLFNPCGTLAGYEKEVEQVVKMYTKGINEFEHTYKHNGNKATFKLNINRHGVMCLGYKQPNGKWFYQCAMDRHLTEQMQLLVILSKTSTDELMQTMFIPNNVSYCNKYAEKQQYA